jgi:diguanylate cyclase (GGDEF)-like protein
VTVDGAPAPLSAVLLSPRARELTVDFALLSWHREAESRFRTELVGHDAGPGEWTAKASRSFGALPAGSYRLRVEARDFAGNESVPLELPIVVLAAWWNSLLARTLFLLAAILLVAALFAARTRQLRARQRRLEQEVAERTTELYVANARLLDLSYQDALTGLANRRRMLETLESTVATASPRDLPTALIFVDVDHFKEYNDRFGHPAGDEALRGVAAVMRAEAPARALVARYGGEEFACLLFATDLEAAVAVAERIRAGVAERDVPVPGTELTNRITLSAGVAALPLATPADPHRLLRDADIALYQAKRDGRNCVRASH